MKYNRCGLPKIDKPKPIYKALNYIIWGVVILLLLWWLLKA